MIGLGCESSNGSCSLVQEVEGLHTFRGMMGYCMNGNGEDNFEAIHNHVSSQDMNACKLEYMKFGKIGLNNQDLIATISKGHINKLDFIRRNTWVLCYRKIVSHVQKQLILPKYGLGNYIEVRHHGCEACGFDSV